MTSGAGILRRRPGYERSQEGRRQVATINKTVVDNNSQGLKKLAYVVVPILETVGPFMLKCFRLLYEIYKVLPMNVIGMLYGLIMCFFGGSLHVTIAAIVAFKMSAGEDVMKYITQLREDLEEVRRVSKEDDKRDDDNDGIPDVNQIGTEQLLARKLNLALRVIDPERSMKAIQGIWQGYMGVLVTLKFRFAKVITLAVSIGNNMRPIVETIVGPALTSAIPGEGQKWIGPATNYFCKFMAMIIAWWIQRIISIVQSAILGGLLFARSFMRFISDVTPLKLDPDNSYIDEILGWILAAYGAYFQISNSWELPWLVDVLLWPAHLLEIFFKWSVSRMDAPPEGP